MRRIRITALLIITMTLGIAFSACAKGDKNYSYKEDAYNFDSTAAQDGGASDEYKSSVDNSSLASTAPITTGNTADLSMDKIITTVNLEVETQDFDELINTIMDEIVRLGGYDERTEINGRGYYRSNDSRYGYIVARIPKTRLDEFVDVVKDNGNVINEKSSSDNVTLQYVDTESRKKSLEIEQERLWSFLEKTEKVEDIITLQSRLSSIQYEIQMYETELRTLDNKVDYSTVTLTVYEVERMTPTSEEKETVFTRIKNGFSKSIFDISEGFKNFFVWFVVNLPYLIIWAIVITATVIISRKIYKKRKNYKEAIPELRDIAKKEDSDK